MKLFQKTQIYFMASGFRPNSKRLDPIHYVGIFITSAAFLLNFMFLINVAKTVEELTVSLYILTATVALSLCYANTIFKTSKLFEYFNQFDENVTTRITNSPASMAVHIKSNQLVEKLCEILFFLFVHVSGMGFIIPYIEVSFFVYFTSDLGPDAFELPLKMWFPFDWQTPSGYLIAAGCQYAMAFYAFRFLACLACTTLGSYLSAVTLANDIDDDLNVINESAKAQKSALQIFKQLSEFIRAHSNGKLLLETYSDVYENILTVLFTWCLLTICLSLLMIQMQITHHDIMSVLSLEAIFFTVWSFGLVAFACELGQRVTDALGQIDETIDTLDWYLYPIEIQKMLPIIIVNAHKAVVCKCFGDIACSRQTFEQVVNKAYSYFMTLHKFY